MRLYALSAALLSSALLAQAPPSTIALPIRVNLEPVFQAAERTVPKVPAGVETWAPLPNSGAKVYRFNLYRDPLTLRLVNNRVTVRTAVHYWMEVGLRMGSLIKSMGSCGLGPEGFRHAWLGAQADFGITPQWGVDLRVSTFDPMPSNACTITFLGYDITNQVLAGMKDAMARGLQGMEQQARESAMLRRKAEDVWRMAQQPIEVSHGVFLVLNPEQIRLGPLSSDGHTLVVTPEIQARPFLQLGNRPEITLRPLPDLVPLNGNPSPTFRIQVDADLGYREASEQLRRQMVGKVFETGNGRFEILDASVRGQGRQAILEVELKGKVNGRLALAGTPHFNAQKGTLELLDLDYTLESRSWITKFGEWLFRSSLRKTLAEKSNWFLQKNFQDLKAQVQGGMNREIAPGVALNGQLDQLTLEQPQLLSDRFRVQAFMEGRIQVTLTPSGL